MIIYIYICIFVYTHDMYMYILGIIIKGLRTHKSLTFLDQHRKNTFNTIEFDSPMGSPPNRLNQAISNHHLDMGHGPMSHG